MGLGNKIEQVMESDKPHHKFVQGIAMSLLAFLAFGVVFGALYGAACALMYICAKFGVIAVLLATVAIISIVAGFISAATPSRSAGGPTRNDHGD